MVYWLLAFTIAFEEMILACTFACKYTGFINKKGKIMFSYLAYYWEINKSNDNCCHGYFNKCLCLQGLSITVCHHLGTIAFGSSIIAILDTLRTLIDLVKDHMERMNLDHYGKCCLTMINHFLACIRCCFRFFSRYTYIMVLDSLKASIFLVAQKTFIV